MARIIKPGIRRYKELRGTCKKCTCVFAVDPAEAKEGSTFNGEVSTYALCPCCGADVTGLTEEWVTVDYGPPKMTPPPQPWQHPHMEPPKPRL